MRGKSLVLTVITCARQFRLKARRKLTGASSRLPARSGADRVKARLYASHMLPIQSKKVGKVILGYFYHEEEPLHHTCVLIRKGLDFQRLEARPSIA